MERIHEIYRLGGVQDTTIRGMHRVEMQDRRDAGQKRGRTVGMHNRRDAGQEQYTTGEMQDRRDAVHILSTHFPRSPKGL